MKKTLAIVLSLAMLVVVLLTAGCNNTPEQVGGDKTTTTTTGDATTQSSGDVVTDASGDPVTDASGNEVTDTTTGSVVTDASGNTVTDASGNAVTTVPSGTTQGGTTQGGTTGNKTSAGGKNTTTSKQQGGKTTTTKYVPKVPVLDDELNDLKKTYEHGKQYLMESQFDYFFENDSSRVIPGSTYVTDSWLTYKMDVIEEFEIVSYRCIDPTTLGPEGITKMSFYLSTDNKKWDKVSVKEKVLGMSSQWEKVVYTKTGVSSKYKFLKIEFPKASCAFSFNLGRVRINDLAHMYDVTRYREGRESATFYVDAQNGNDNNDGMSPEKALKSLYAVSQRYFQPGDKLLFKRGCTFSGQLSLNGDGEAKNKILVGAYGSGALPIIKSRTGTAITMKAMHITVENLCITNPGGERGLYVLAPFTGAIKGITIRNCEFRDINLNSKQGSAFENAAIYVMAGGIDPTWFDGLLIENNTFKNVCSVGLWMSTNWAARPGGWGSNQYVNDSKEWYPAKNVVVRGNKLDTLGGDGLVIYGAANPIMEKNVLYRGYQSSQSEQERGSAGIWVHNTNDAVLQYNEVAYMELIPGHIDGEAFNIDIANKRTLVQYNYSHNNTAGFLLMCNHSAPSEGHIVRYNVSINDYGEYTKSYHFQGILMISGDIKDSKIYNNTIYMGGEARVCNPIRMENFSGMGDLLSGFTFSNNIFHAEKGIDVKWSLNCKNLTFNNNIYSGTCPAPNVKDLDGKTVKDADGKVQTVTFAGKIPANLDGRAKALNVRLAKNIKGAAFVKGDAKVDFEGKKITSPFYGALIPKA